MHLVRSWWKTSSLFVFNFLTLHFLEELHYLPGIHSVLFSYRLTSQKADSNISNLLMIYLTRCLEVTDALLESQTLPLIFLYNFIHLWHFLPRLYPTGSWRVLRYNIENTSMSPEHTYLSSKLHSFAIEYFSLFSLLFKW